MCLGEDLSKFGEDNKGIPMPCVILPKIHPGVFTFDCAARDPAEK
jgi:hypothetical protein